ncbi:hypothetical protein D3C86_2171290 [compost metagenome]
MGATPSEARQAAQAYLLRTLESNGAPPEEAKALVAAMDRATQARPTTEGKAFPPGMLMAR